MDYPCAVFRCDRGGCDRQVINTDPTPGEQFLLPDGWYRVNAHDPAVKSWTLCSKGCLSRWAIAHAAPF